MTWWISDLHMQRGMVARVGATSAEWSQRINRIDLCLRLAEDPAGPDFLRLCRSLCWNLLKQLLARPGCTGCLRNSGEPWQLQISMPRNQLRSGGLLYAESGPVEAWNLWAPTSRRAHGERRESARHDGCKLAVCLPTNAPILRQDGGCK